MDPLHLDWTKLDDLTLYVIKNYAHLMTKQESHAWNCIIRREKSIWNASRKNVLEAEQAFDEVYGSKELLANGTKVFLVRTRMRVMDENVGRVFVNRCPTCTAIVATPRAKQCLYCGHDWH